MKNADHNLTMPQAKFFFVYVLWREDDPKPLQCHLAFGFTKESTEETRRLVRSGVPVGQLLSMSEVHELLPYHTRRMEKLFEPLEPGNWEPADHPGTDGVASTLFTGSAKVTA